MESNDRSIFNPLISVIVPVYNAQKYISICVESIISQTYRNFEIVIIDDGSSDSSIEILKEYEKKDHRIHIVSQPNSGVSAARNNGLTHAKGEYIVFVDSDDWIDCNMLSKAVETLEKTKAEIVMWGYMREYPKVSKPTLYFGDKLIQWKDETAHLIFRRMIGPVESELKSPQTLDSMITVWGKIYKKEILSDIKFIDLKLIGTEDTLFNIQVFENINNAVYIPDPMYHYRKTDPNTLSKTYNREKINQWYTLYQRVKKQLNNRGASKDYYDALDNRVCLWLVGHGLNLIGDSSLNYSAKYKELAEILDNRWLQQALKKLTKKYFPLHWKVFFFMAKYKLTFALLLYLRIIDQLRRL